MMKYFLKIKFFTLYFLIQLINIYGFEYSQTDTNITYKPVEYNISRSIISSGGTLGAFSTSYRHHSTFGETLIGRTQGINNIVIGGFWAMSLVITDVEEKPFKEIPTTFKLFQNFPNPFNPTTKIIYGIPENGHVKISLFNLIGEEIKVLLNEEKQTGYYTVEYNGRELPSGVYFYRIQATSNSGQSSTYVETKKMVLMK